MPPLESLCPGSPLAAAQGRVGEHEVDGGFGELGEEFEGVGVVELEVVFGVLEGGF